MIYHNISDDTFVLQRLSELPEVSLEFEVEVDVLLFSDADWLDAFLDGVDPPEELSLLVVLGVLDNAASELDSVNGLPSGLKASELVGVELLHHCLFEVQHFLKGIGGAAAVHALRRPQNSL